MSIALIEQITDRVIFVHLDIRCWSGRKTLQPEDLGLSRSQLPPEDLVSLGSKTLLDPAELKAFTGLRSAARRACLAQGTRFLSGFIVPADHAQTLLDRLSELETRFHEQREAFLHTFDATVEHWVQKHPAWEVLIRRSLVTRHYVAERLGFTVQAVRLVAAGEVNHPGLVTAAHGLADTLFREVAQLAHITLAKSFLGRSHVTRRALRPLLALQRKLEGLAFLDPRVRPLVEDIRQTLLTVAAQGPIEGRDLQALIGLLALLEDPARLKAHGAQLLAGESASADAEADAEPEPEPEPEPESEPIADTITVPALPPAPAPALPAGGWFF